MSTVYVIWDGHYEEIDSVWSSREEAIKRAKEWNGSERQQGAVFAFVLDTPAGEIEELREGAETLGL